MDAWPEPVLGLTCGPACAQAKAEWAIFQSVGKTYRPTPPTGADIFMRLILGFGVVAWRSGDQGTNEGGEQLFAPFSGVVNKLEEPEIDWKLFL